MRKITTRKGVELLVPEKGEKHPGAGRPKGAKNVMTREVKKAILLAAAESQHAKDYGGGVAGYCTYLATEHPEAFAKLLARLDTAERGTRQNPGARGKQNGSRSPYGTDRAWQGRYDEGHAIIECDRRAVQKGKT